MGKRIILKKGEKYGSWTVIKDLGSIKGRARSKCRCDCGRLSDKSNADLKSGKAKRCISCAAKEHRKPDMSIIGKKFGHWLVIEYSGIKGTAHSFLCRCKCGYEMRISVSVLKRGRTKMCHLCANKIHNEKQRTKKLEGKKLGGYTVIKYLGNKKYLCRCDCGAENIVSTVNLKRNSHGCNECNKTARVINRKGIKHFSLTAVKRIHKSTWLWECDCGNTIEANYHDVEKGKVVHCSSCSKSRSYAEKELSEFLSKYTKVENTAKIYGDNRTVDIYLPELKMAIEYNGLHWHTEEKGKTRCYHAEKTKAAKKNGVRLIHLWEDDYTKNKEKIQNWLLSVFNISVTRIFGRETTFSIVDKKIAYDFEDAYHIQSSHKSASFCFGLYKNDELVSVASFKNNGKEMQLTRYTVKNGINIIGGFAKIIKNAILEMNVEKITTFADLCWIDSKKNTYLRNGFLQISEIKPDYRYVYNNERKHKFGFRLKKLRKIFPESTGTEREICKENKIGRIWDCGKIKYEWKLK